MKNKNFKLNSSLVISVLIIAYASICFGSCPESNDTVHRLGRSRFYMLQKDGGRLEKTWEEGKAICIGLGLDLAKIDSLEDDVYLGRLLDKFLGDKGKWASTYFWLNAKFDQKQQTYIWQDDKKPLKFSNFFYRFGLPKGLGDFFGKGRFFISDPKKRAQTCLSFSLPLPFKPYYGHATSWWELFCTETWFNNIMCESSHPACEEEQHLSDFTEKPNVYYKGLWLMSNRRYVVNFEPKNYKDAKAFCEGYGLQIFEPSKNDECLIPVIKNWMRRMTTYNFWSNAIFDLRDRKFKYPNGTIIPDSYQKRKHTNDFTRGEYGSDLEISKWTCASMMWNNEITPNDVNVCKCDYNLLQMGPENCKNPMGVICQHKDYADRPCTTEFVSPPLTPKNYSGNSTIRKFKEFYPFGEKTKDLLRSAFKQRGDRGSCPEGYRRVTANDQYWTTSFDEYENSEYKYDYTETYWMNKDKEGKCKTSIVTYDPHKNKIKRHIQEQDCTTSFHGFFLCIVDKDKHGRSMRRRKKEKRSHGFDEPD